MIRVKEKNNGLFRRSQKRFPQGNRRFSKQRECGNPAGINSHYHSPHGPSHQLYTHKGWDYDYSQEEDKDYWNAIDIKQSWEVKKYLLVKAVGKIYSISGQRAKALSVLFYNIHKLRDIQFNEYTAKKNYLLNTCDEIIEYVLPEITDTDLKDQVHTLVASAKKMQAAFSGPISDDFWQELNKPIDKLIGSINSSEAGLFSKVVSLLGDGCLWRAK